MKKIIDFKELHVAIQQLADDKFEGNFNMAVRYLIVEGMKSEQATAGYIGAGRTCKNRNQ